MGQQSTSKKVKRAAMKIGKSVAFKESTIHPLNHMQVFAIQLAGVKHGTPQPRQKKSH